jgi:hypothetical protein
MCLLGAAVFVQGHSFNLAEIPAGYDATTRKIRRLDSHNSAVHENNKSEEHEEEGDVKHIQGTRKIEQYCAVFSNSILLLLWDNIEFFPLKVFSVCLLSRPALTNIYN